MKAKEIRNLTDDELRAKAQDSRSELFNLRMQQVGGTLEKPSRIRLVRKDLARTETILSERAIAARSKA
jgi:large subunit ribosomal protein L29